MRTMSRTSIAWMLWPVPPNRPLHVRMVVGVTRAVVVAIAIAIVAGEGGAEALEAIVEATAGTVATAVVDAVGGRNTVLSYQFSVVSKCEGPQRCGPFIFGYPSLRHADCQNDRRLRIVSGMCSTALIT